MRDESTADDEIGSGSVRYTVHHPNNPHMFIIFVFHVAFEKLVRK